MSNSYFKELDYQILDKKTVYQGKRLTVEEVNYYNPRKKQTVYREHILAGSAVLMIPVTDDNKFIMIQEPRTPIGKTILAFPAGMLDENEALETGAIRELEEETGYHAKKIKKLRQIYPAVGYSDEKITIFLAQDLIKTKRHLDETEDINVIEIEVDKVKKMLDNNEIITSSEVVALLHYFNYEEAKN